MKKGDTIQYLDYEIVYCTNNDGIVLSKKVVGSGNLWETHLGNYATPEHAKGAALIFFMLARPQHFASCLFFKLLRRGGTMSEFTKLRNVLKDEGLDMPPEITSGDGLNNLIYYNGRPLAFLFDEAKYQVARRMKILTEPIDEKEARQAANFWRELFLEG